MATTRTPPLLKLTPTQRKRISGALDAKLIGAGLAHTKSQQTGDEYHEKYMKAMERYAEVIAALAVLGVQLDEHEVQPILKGDHRKTSPTAKTNGRQFGRITNGGVS